MTPANVAALVGPVALFLGIVAVGLSAADLRRAGEADRCESCLREGPTDPVVFFSDGAAFAVCAGCAPLAGPGRVREFS